MEKTTSHVTLPPPEEASPQDVLFLAELAKLLDLSDDPVTHFSAIIVKDGVILATGTNRLPLGVQALPARLTRPEKYFWIEHAERHAILAAAKSGQALAGTTMYAQCMPCIECCRAAAVAGITTIVADYGMTIGYTQSGTHWVEGFKRSAQLLEEAGVKLRLVNAG